FGHKSEIRSFEADDKSPVWWKHWGGRMCLGLRLVKSGMGGEDAFSKKRKCPCGGGWVGVSLAGGSVNDQPKSIDLKGWETNRSLVQMESSSVVLNIQLSKPPLLAALNEPMLHLYECSEIYVARVIKVSHIGQLGAVHK
ncbi:hypothetical protein AVEN_49274-1, partial [Araneus ventricosus]